MNIFFILLCTDAIYSEKETEKVYYGIFILFSYTQKNRRTFALFHPYSEEYISVDEPMTICLFLFFRFCPILDGAFWNEMKSTRNVGRSQNTIELIFKARSWVRKFLVKKS